MARIPRLSKRIQTKILKEAAEILAGLYSLSPGTPLQLGAGFELYHLDIAATDKLREPFKVQEVLRDIERWHVLLLADSKPSYYARAFPKAGTPASWQVTEVGASERVRPLARAVEWLESNDPSKDCTRLIYVPTHRVQALWLEGRDQDRVLVTFRPARMKDIRYRKFYQFPEFVEKIINHEPFQAIVRERT